MLLGFAPFGLPDVMLANLNVNSGVIGIPLESLIVEIHVIKSGVVELIHTQAGKVKFLDRLVLGNRFCTVNHFRQFFARLSKSFVRIVYRTVIYHKVALRISESGVQIFPFHIRRNNDGLKKVLVGIDVDSLVQQDLVSGGEYDPRVPHLNGGIIAQKPFAILKVLQVDCRKLRGILYSLNSFNREPCLFELTYLTWSKPAIVRLIVRIAPHHKLKIVTVLVRQNLVPQHSCRVVPPEEEFLAGDLETVGDMDRSGILTIVVAPDKTHSAAPGKD